MAIDFQSGSEREVPAAVGARSPGSRGFTLIELLVSTAIMLIVMLVLLQVIAGMTNIWHNSTGTISSFQGARAAFTTLTRTLSRATLKTYIDYVDSNGNPITNANVNTSNGFVPIASFTRASELQFTCGPTMSMAGNNSIPTASALNFPGDCVFFQAPLGIVNTDTTKVTNGAADKFLQKSLNSIGFYVQYFGFTSTGDLPSWLATALGIAGATRSVYGYRLMEFVQPTENFDTYNWTSEAGTGAYADSMDYIPQSLTVTAAQSGATFAAAGKVGTYNSSVIVADNVTLLIIRPRVEPQDEQALAGSSGELLYSAATAYNDTMGSATINSIISPNYNYDSRAWWGGGMTVTAGNPPTYTVNSPVSTRFTSTTPKASNYIRLMRNQLPPILDVAMVAVDPNSIIRLGNTSTPPVALQVPTTAFPTTSPYLASTQIPNSAFTVPFSGSANMDADLYNYGVQLSLSHIRYRIFRASVQLEGAAWVNSY